MGEEGILFYAVCLSYRCKPGEGFLDDTAGGGVNNRNVTGVERISVANVGCAVATRGRFLKWEQVPQATSCRNSITYANNICND